MNSKTNPLDNEEDPKRPQPTGVLSQSRIRRMGHTPQTDDLEQTLDEQKQEVIFVIRGIVERFVMSENQQLILGRSDPASRHRPDVDLSPYGAVERGVSRSHASLRLSGRKLYLTDLGSTNGTFIGGRQLTPHKPEYIRKGEEFLLGRLSVTVLYT